MKWMNLNCVAPAFPLGPKHSQLARAGWQELAMAEKSHMTDRILSQDFLSCSLVHNHCVTGDS